MTVSRVGSGSRIVLLNTKTLTGSGAVTFSNIPQQYRKLILEIINPSADADVTLLIRPNNGDSDSNRLVGTTASSFLNDSIQPGTIDATTADGVIAIEFFNYSSSTSHKPFMFYGGMEDSSNVDQPIFGGGRYKSNSPITSIEINKVSAFALWDGGTANLYGE